MKLHKINGDAGTGKTHAAIQKIKDLIQRKIKFVLVTPTHKAARVLNMRLVAAGIQPLAGTLHSKLFKWTPTDVIKSRKNVRRVNPETKQFVKDADGNPVYDIELEYVWERSFKEELANYTILVDEASMVGANVWFDLDYNIVGDVFAFGDEKQLPPIEEYASLHNNLKPFYRYWAKQTENVTSLNVNHRQAGDLKTFVNTVKDTLFNKRTDQQIPCPFIVGVNESLLFSQVNDNDFLKCILDADVVITPYNALRMEINEISRRSNALHNHREYTKLPVVGDKIIFVDPVKVTTTNSKGERFRTIKLTKNTTAVIEKIYDISEEDNLMICDIRDDAGEFHESEKLSLESILGRERFDGDFPRINYAYAITAHSSQGSEWDRVLFLNGWWKDPDDAARLRYVGITRAKESITVINGVPNIKPYEKATTNRVRNLTVVLSQCAEKEIA